MGSGDLWVLGNPCVVWDFARWIQVSGGLCLCAAATSVHLRFGVGGVRFSVEMLR